MSGTSETIEYYQSTFGLSAVEAEHLCIPQVLFNQQTLPLGISVRDARHGHEERKDDLLQVEDTAKQYMSQIGRPTIALLDNMDLPPHKRYQRPEQPSILAGKILQKLIEPKLKTGTITSLSISAVSPSELPFAIKVTSGPRKNYIDGLDAYYRVEGAARLGSKTGSIACGIRVTPVIEIFTPQFVYLSLEGKIRRFSPNHTTALRQWRAGKEAARNQEGKNKRYPFSGGLPS